MKVILSAIDPRQTRIWADAFSDVPSSEVLIVNQSILDLSVDAVVSPANSFGFMDGNLDLNYSQFFGWHVQEQLRTQISELPIGELLVGQALCISTGNDRIPHVISAPTMRAPYPIKDTLNIYLATKAALVLAKACGFKSVALPALGTGAGAVPYYVCALHMRAGYDHFKNPPVYASWREAKVFELSLRAMFKV